MAIIRLYSRELREENRDSLVKIDTNMTNQPFTPTELEAYLDEALPPDAMAAVEEQLRADTDLAQQLASINSRRDAGVHSLGGIWRRARLSCPTREQLGSYLLEALSDDAATYIRFHLETVGCRYCTANLADMQAQHARSDTDSDHRRRKYYQTSAGYLTGKQGDK